MITIAICWALIAINRLSLQFTGLPPQFTKFILQFTRLIITIYTNFQACRRKRYMRRVHTHTHMRRPDRQELELSKFGPRADVANDSMAGGGSLGGECGGLCFNDRPGSTLRWHGREQYRSRTSTSSLLSLSLSSGHAR